MHPIIIIIIEITPDVCFVIRIFYTVHTVLSRSTSLNSIEYRVIRSVVSAMTIDCMTLYSKMGFILPSTFFMVETSINTCIK